PNKLHDEWTFRVAVAVLFPEPATATATAPRSARPPALLQRQPRRRLRVEPVRAREGASPVRGGRRDAALVGGGADPEQQRRRAGGAALMSGCRRGGPRAREVAP